MIKVISSGSKGNAVLYGGIALVDIGVPFSKIKPYLKDLKVVLLTHQHLDHLNLAVLRRLVLERPTIRIGAGEWLSDKLEGLNVDYLKIGQWYDYRLFKVATGKLYHDVPNCFYRLDFDGYKIFHATDTAHLEGISAKEYDLYAIEHNYDEDKAEKIIQEAYLNGKYTHLAGSIKSHLSVQQAHKWLLENMKQESKVVRLHESSTAL